MTDTAVTEVGRSEPADLRACADAWRSRERNPESTNPAWYLTLAKRALDLGDPLFAYEIGSEGVERWPDRADLRTQLALAVASSGALESALENAEALYKEGHRSVDLLGLLGRSHKDLWRQNGKARDLKESIRYYEDGYRRYHREEFLGVNAATLMSCAGNVKRARELARDVLQVCFEKLAAAPATAFELGRLLPWSMPAVPKQKPAADERTCNDYWLLATVGEAALVLDNVQLATLAYRSAQKAPNAGVRNLATTRRNAELLLARRPGGDDLLQELFPRPRIAVFCGHMIDRTGRGAARFPPAAVPGARAAIKRWLEKNPVTVGYASAASGSDLLFHAALDTLRIDRYMLLPQKRDVFRKHSVAWAGQRWLREYEYLIDTATDVTEVTDDVTDVESYRYANRMIAGYARARARRIGGEVVGLALWDGRPGKGGGTDTAVAEWLAAGVPVTAIHPQTGKERKLTPTRSGNLPAARRRSTGEDARETVAMLFADVVGFSKLTERQLSPFIDHFLKPVGRFVHAGKNRPIAANTWGDGLFMTFLSATDAGCFALRLCEFVSSGNWVRLGLPGHTNIRIGLHAGPAIRISDPVTGKLNFFGSNVSRAARIEPITPPGQVYCSEPFAALVEIEAANTIVCEYVGQTAMAKRYGSFPTYRVRAAAKSR